MNDYVFFEYGELFPNISINNNVLTYNGKSINLDGISLDEIFKNNKVIEMDEDNLFQLIMLESLTREKEKKEKEILEDLNKEQGVIHNLAIIELENNGVKKNYVHYIDDQGFDHILYNYVPTDVLRVYANLLKNNNGVVTEKELFNELNRKMYDLNLEASYNNSNTSLLFQEELEHHEKNNNTGSYAKKNDEHALIVDNHVIYTTRVDENGNVYRSKSMMNEDNDLDREKQNVDVETKEEDKTIGLTEKEFFTYLSLDRTYTEEEKIQIDDYYSFIYEIMVNKDYVTADTLKYLNDYNLFIENLIIKSTSNSLNENETKALEKYEEMQEKLKNDTRFYKKDDVLRLTRTLPKTGFTSTILIILFTIISGIMIGTIIYFTLR